MTNTLRRQGARAASMQTSLQMTVGEGLQLLLMLVCARLRHVAGTEWGIKRYMNMDHLHELDMEFIRSRIISFANSIS